MTPTTKRIRDSFDRQSLMQTLGATIVSVIESEVIIEAPILPGARQQHGFGHAGLTFAIGDSAAGYSALTMMVPEAEVLTVEMKINLLAPARGDLLRATGKVIKSGRRLIVVQARVTAIDQAQETDIALLQGTMIPA